MKKTFILICTVIFLGGTINTAKALTLSTVNGIWSNAVNGSSVIFPANVPNNSYVNRPENQIKWGNPVPSSGEQSGLGFTGVAPPQSVFGINDVFEIGQLRHFNNPIETGTHVSSVDLTINTVFTDFNESFSFAFQIDETVNTPGPVDDIIYFPSSFASEVFLINGTEFTLQLLGFGDTANNLFDLFTSAEGKTNDTLLWGRIITRCYPVPEPATMLLLGSGLIGMIGYKRNKSARS